MSESLTYETAFRELKQIESDIAGENISVDLLSEKIQRASFLLQFCQAKLRATEEEVGKIISKLEKGGATN